MTGLDASLAGAKVRCLVLQGDDVVCDFVPASRDELWAMVEIPELGEKVRVDLLAACEQFVSSCQDSFIVGGEACRTIVKFGAPIQFKESYVVEFERLDA